MDDYEDLGPVSEMVDAALDDETTETYSNDGAECPYCHKVTRPDGEPFFYNDDRNEIECGWCEKPFTFTYFRRDSWTSKPLSTGGGNSAAGKQG